MNRTEKVRQLLISRPDLPQTEIAKLAGVCESLVSRVKNNVNPLKVGPPIKGFDIETVVRERMISLNVSVFSLSRVSGIHTERIRSFRNKRSNLNQTAIFSLAEALGLRFYVEYMNVYELPPKHPAHRLLTSGHGGRKPRSVWGRRLPAAEPADEARQAAISAYASARAQAASPDEA